MVKKIISGGQTGADQGGLCAAYDAGVQTGGWCPKGWRTESGSAEWLSEYGLVETEHNDWRSRTTRNVLDSDCTVVFGDLESRGTALTIKLCEAHSKDVYKNPSLSELASIFQNYDVVNIAGNRESQASGIQEQVYETVASALQLLDK